MFYTIVIWHVYVQIYSIDEYIASLKLVSRQFKCPRENWVCLKFPWTRNSLLNGLVETRTKLEELIPAGMVEYGLNRVYSSPCGCSSLCLCSRQADDASSAWYLNPGYPPQVITFFFTLTAHSGPSFTMLSPFAQKCKVKLHSGITHSLVPIELPFIRLITTTSSPCS